MKYLTFFSVASLLRTSLAKPIQPEYSHSIPQVLSEGEPIQNWNLQGTTKVQTDYITLTDLGKPNQRGSAWSLLPNDYEKWTIDLDFSVAGPIDPGGGLALWYTTKPGVLGPVHGSNDKWDGLAVIIDSIGEGVVSDIGTIRGYLNDGSFEYLSEPKPVTKAFASCQLAYRNTGYNTQVKVSYMPGFLRIKVNGQLCFQTDHIVLPKGGYFGITAQNTENADSFSLRRVQVYSVIVPPMDEPVPGSVKKVQQQADALQKQQQREQDSIKMKPRDGDNKALDIILAKLSSLSSPSPRADAAPNELSEDLQKLQQFQLHNQISLEKRIASLEAVIKELIDMQRKTLEKGTAASSNEQVQKNKLESDMKKLHNRLDEINSAVKEHTVNLAGSIPQSVSDAISKGRTSIWMVFTLLIFIQGGVFVGYLVYKTRRGSYHAKLP